MANFKLVSNWFSTNDLDKLLKCLEAGDKLEINFFDRPACNPFYHWTLCIENEKRPVIIHFSQGQTHAPLRGTGSGFGKVCHLMTDSLMDVIRPGDQVRINNEDDKDYEPLSIDEIIENVVAELTSEATKTGKNIFSTVTNNCEHFVNRCRYGISFSRQVESLQRGAEAAGMGLGLSLTLLKFGRFVPYVGAVCSGLTICSVALMGFQAYLNRKKK